MVAQTDLTELPAPQLPSVGQDQEAALSFLAGIPAKTVRGEHRADPVAERPAGGGSLLNRDRNNPGFDGKGVGARHRKLHRRRDANSATDSKTFSPA